MSAPPCLIGLPYDASSSFRRGPAKAPPLIRAALHSDASNRWSESGHDLDTPGVWHEAGDLALPPTTDSRDLITAGIAAVIASGRRPIALGGDHSVTYPVLRAIHAAHGPVTILHVDAHPDLYASFAGDRFSHACPFARIMEAGLAHRLVQVGIRTFNGRQRAQAERFGVEVIDMRAWAAGVRPLGLTGPVYCSIDLDGIDPAFAPGVSHREPGGLTVREVITLVQALPASLVGADVVEYNPDTDLDGITAPVAAKLVKELVGRMHDRA